MDRSITVEYTLTRQQIHSLDLETWQRLSAYQNRYAVNPDTITWRVPEHELVIILLKKKDRK